MITVGCQLNNVCIRLAVGCMEVLAWTGIEIDRTIDDLVDRFGVSCLGLDPDDRPNWLKRILEDLDLPLEPPQLRLFNDVKKDQY